MLKFNPQRIFLSILLVILIYNIGEVQAQYDIAAEFQSEADGNSAINTDLAASHSPAFIFSFSGQPSESKPETIDYYLHKSKNQKTTAWVLLGGGTALTIIGLIGFDANFDIWSDDEAQNRRTDFFGFVTLTGMIADVISVPFFISAHKNKKKAAHLSLGNQPIYYFPPNSNNLNMNAALTLKIDF